MSGKFVCSKSKDGQEFFVLKASNGQVILQSERYKSSKSCANGIESVRKNSQDESRFECKTAKDGRTYFNLKASNGQVIGKSQMYKSDSGCRNGMASVAKHAPTAVVVEG
jgi:uncharacterized protein YegP (UPF0339 family)